MDVRSLNFRTKSVTRVLTLLIDRRWFFVSSKPAKTLVVCSVNARSVRLSVGLQENFKKNYMRRNARDIGMLTSCASNVTVVNIDNGFGAAHVATLINRL